ncbi:MFS transporter [Nocardioides sp. GY 10113]|uniref:MFS transporter n=1 Tax=Nocardioides sp. GY 10113 TaxID=2569761 RepID=UPI001458ED32|nr:MFS transporter [Nocardioides sp. GY 10113]
MPVSPAVPGPPDADRPRSDRVGAAVLLLAVLLLALSLRTGIGSLSVLLPTVRDELGFSATGVSLLTTLPPLCFAVVGLGAGRLVLRHGVHRVTVVLLLVIAAGLVGRALTGSPMVFLGATVVAMAAVAVGNVVLPPLANRHFRQPGSRISATTVSSLYGATIVGGATLAAMATVPVGEALGGWRVGLACWALVPAVAAVLWLPTLRSDRADARAAAAAASAAGPAVEPTVEPTVGPTVGPTATTHPPAGPAPAITLAAVARTPLGWAFGGCFAIQAGQAYVQFGWWGSILADAGADASRAGLLLGMITGVGIPVTLALPTLIRMTRGSIALPVLFAAATIAGWAGLLAAPLALGGFPWAVLLGFGGGAFTWILAMVAHHSRTPQGTSQLSALTQGVGYLGASVATFGAGVLHDATGSWTAPVLVMAVLAALIGVFGAAIVRGGSVEDAVARVA